MTIILILIALACLVVMVQFWRSSLIVIAALGVACAILLIAATTPQPVVQPASLVQEWTAHPANPDMLCTSTKTGVLSCRLR